MYLSMPEADWAVFRIRRGNALPGPRTHKLTRGKLGPLRRLVQLGCFHSSELFFSPFTSHPPSHPLLLGAI